MKRSSPIVWRNAVEKIAPPIKANERRLIGWIFSRDHGDAELNSPEENPRPNSLRPINYLSRDRGGGETAD